MKWYIVYFFLIRCLRANAAEEEYREELTLRPLVDGKVAAHFSFSTLLHGAVPRAPSTLGTDDICMPCITPSLHPYFLTAECLSSPALQHLSPGARPDSPRARYSRVPPDDELGEMGL